MIDNNCGIYEILNLKNGKRYIGSSSNLKRREREHFRELENGIHDNLHLQNAYNKYGKDSFTFNILEYAYKENLLIREQYYFDLLNSKLLYNKCKVAGHPPKFSKENHPSYGKKWSAESKAKASDSAKKRKASLETRAKLSKALSERVIKDETREKLRIASASRKHTEETKQKISSANTGKIRSEQAIQKAIASRNGYVHSEETKEKIRISNIGKKRSEETREKVRQAKLGLIPTEETKIKLSESTGKRVSIDGVIYRSNRHAATILNIGKSTIHSRIHSDKFPNYFYV